MSVPYHQQRRLRRLHHTLVISEPRLAALLVTFARLYAGEEMPAWEQVQRRPQWPLRALALTVWAVLCLCGRALAACGRLPRSCLRLLRLSLRPLHPCGQFLRRIAVRCLVAWSFLPGGFRLAAGAWLVTHYPPVSVPSAPHRGNRSP
jgi:hypothetical protein